MPAKPLAGDCQCGAVRYEITGAPLAVYVCHCRECRKQSASAFGISAIVRVADFRLVQGSVTVWTRDTDSGRRLRCAFCPRCGSRLWHEGEPKGATVSVKGGSLDDALDLSTASISGPRGTCRALSFRPTVLYSPRNHRATARISRVAGRRSSAICNPCEDNS